MQLMKNTIRMTIVMIAAVIALYSYAADRSGIDIETLVETVYLGDTDSFIELKDRAKSDDSAAQLALARLYNVGRNYNTKTPESSNALADIGSSDKYEYWLKKSADGGNAEAAEELGCLYLREAEKLEDLYAGSEFASRFDADAGSSIVLMEKQIDSLFSKWKSLAMDSYEAYREWGDASSFFHCERDFFSRYC